MITMTVIDSISFRARRRGIFRPESIVTGIEAGGGALFGGQVDLDDLVHYIVHNVVVKRVNIHDAKTNLSRYLAELAPGATLVLCKRNQPVAEIRPLRKKAIRKPRIGVAKGELVVPDAFFDPLPDEILRGFGGR
jgi:antitoxin (DNA-binding transcriptional repressor) of toxin-antitoxin stability system